MLINEQLGNRLLFFLMFHDVLVFCAILMANEGTSTHVAQTECGIAWMTTGIVRVLRVFSYP